MRIAQIAPLIESVPPTLYGGTQRIVSYLTEEMVRQGYEVSLFASGDSKTAAELVRYSDMALRLNSTVKDSLPYHLMMLEGCLVSETEMEEDTGRQPGVLFASGVRAIAERHLGLIYLRTASTLLKRVQSRSFFAFERAAPRMRR